MAVAAACSKTFKHDLAPGTNLSNKLLNIIKFFDVSCMKEVGSKFAFTVFGFYNSANPSFSNSYFIQVTYLSQTHIYSVTVPTTLGR
jgi:hypothetical protein